VTPREDKAGRRHDAHKRTRSDRSHGALPVQSLPHRQQARQRLEHMYDISKLFASFENAEQPLDPALGIITTSLPLCSAILIEIYDDRSKMIVWPSRGRGSAEMQAARESAQATCSYLVGAQPPNRADLVEQQGITLLPQQPESDGTSASRLLVLPLVVANRPPFGILQLEAVHPLDEGDLTFVNAIANQLAIALDRDRAWHQDIALRAYAEERRARAEAATAAAERERSIAESARERYEMLARENSRLYEQAQHAVRAREHVLEVVSHDLKNPLGAIILITGILDEMAAADAERPGFSRSVARIQRAAQSMLRLIEDLLDFSSIDSGRLAVKRQPENPGALLRETLTSFAGAAKQKQLRLTADIAPELPNILCDRERILQVLSNLVGNAIRVTAEGGSVALRIGARGDELVLAVADDGPGISDEDAKHVFDRYWRSQRAEYAGTGLGLAIASEIVHAHGGKLRVDSELGCGATFTFTLPVSGDRE